MQTSQDSILEKNNRKKEMNSVISSIKKEKPTAKRSPVSKKSKSIVSRKSKPNVSPAVSPDSISVRDSVSVQDSVSVPDFVSVSVPVSKTILASDQMSEQSGQKLTSSMFSDKDLSELQFKNEAKLRECERSCEAYNDACKREFDEEDNFNQWINNFQNYDSHNPPHRIGTCDFCDQNVIRAFHEYLHFPS